MKHIVLLFNLSFLFILSAAGQRMSRQEYIETYQDIAVKEMLRTGIPASITLAQGILESGDGNSTLARKANNHFGIKCHDDWKGRKVYHDDDARNECFRKYKNADESYYDHSDFLVTRSRYRFLFELSPTDYKGWAKGLKKAGYATSPTYAKSLIKIIEDNELHQYDLLNENNIPKETFARNHPHKHNEQKNNSRIQETNRVKYVVAKSGESIPGLAEEFGKFPFELARYNDIAKNAPLNQGDKVYIQPKRRKAAHGNDIHIVQEGESMHDISQKYAVRLDKLYQRNGIEEGEQPETGEEIWLRKRKKQAPLNLKIDDTEDEPDDSEFEIQFDG